jgi:hypothetical protein
MPLLAWTVIALFVPPHVTAMTGVCHCIQPLVEIGSHELFDDCFLSRIIGVSLSSPLFIFYIVEY